MTNLIGLHMQDPVPDWGPRAVLPMPPETWHKIFQVEIAREAKHGNEHWPGNPTCRIVYRHHVDHQDPFLFAADKRKAAREFFSRFIDGTFEQHAANVDAVEELNEYFAAGEPADGRAHKIAWAQAVARVWAEEYRPRFPHIRLVLANTAVGNDIPIEVAQAAAQYGAILSYHGYTPVRNGAILADQARWYSDRWQTMDAEYWAAGIGVYWLLTEIGPVGYSQTPNGDVHLHAFAGWAAMDVMNGNAGALAAQLKGQADRMATWNRQNGGRCLGGQVFTTNVHSGWEWFRLVNPALGQVFGELAAHQTPAPPPPPPPTDDRARGIDISHHQGEFNWQGVKAAHPTALGFAMARTTYGTAKDNWIRRNSQECGRLAIPYSGYHFLRPSQDAKAQANECFKWFEYDGALWSLPLWIDVEGDISGDVPTVAQIKAFAARWRELTDHPIGVYTRASLWNNIVGAGDWARAEQPALWLAHYTTAPEPWIPDGWSRWDFWQYSSKGNLPPHVGNLDFNRFRGGVAELQDRIWEWTAYRQPPIPPPPPPPPVTEFDGGALVLWLKDGSQMTIEFGEGDIVTTPPQ